MVKEGFDFWEENAGVFKTTNQDALDIFHLEVSEMHDEIAAAALSKESRKVSQNIAGYIARKIQENMGCDECAKRVE